MTIKKTVFILTTCFMMYSCATSTDSNPFFSEFKTEFGAPPFDKIKIEHYEPAFKKGIEEQTKTFRLLLITSKSPILRIQL